MIYALPSAFTPDMTEGVMFRRVIAWGVDLLLTGMLWAVLCGLLLALGVITLGLSLPLLVLLPLVPFCYGFLTLAAFGATPGQAMLGLAVRDAVTRARPGMGQALISTIGFSLTLATSGLWLAVALVTERHRTLHDFVSGLVVLRASRLTRPAPGWTMGIV